MINDRNILQSNASLTNSDIMKLILLSDRPGQRLLTIRVDDTYLLIYYLSMANTAQVEHEISLLVNYIRSIGKQNSSSGKYETTFGDLFRNDEVQNTFESLAGTLKAAKRRKVISYSSELLLQGVHDKELITLEKNDN